MRSDGLTLPVTGRLTGGVTEKVTHTLAAGGGVLSNLFANGENGFLFGDFGDLTRLFTTSTGLVPVAANDDPVGLALGNSKWAGKTLAQLVAAQTEIVVNGSFSADANWSKDTGWTISGGAFNVNGTAFTLSYQGGVAGLVAGTLYRVQFEITAFTSGGVRFRLDGGVSAVGTTRTAVGVYTEYLIAGAGNNQFSLQATGAGFVGSIDNVSVKAIPGNHALQATSTARPLWKANSGKPYLAPDGNDDFLSTPVIPTVAMTLALACRFTATGGGGFIMLGGGASTNNKRCFIGKNATNGTVAAGWGSETLGTLALGPDLGVTDHVIVLTGDAVSRDIWLDGALLDSRAPTNGPDGTGGGLAIATYNNNGVNTSFSGGRVYAALTMNRRATPAEITGNIHPNFVRTYQ